MQKMQVLRQPEILQRFSAREERDLFFPSLLGLTLVLKNPGAAPFHPVPIKVHRASAIVSTAPYSHDKPQDALPHASCLVHPAHRKHKRKALPENVALLDSCHSNT